MKTHFIPSVHGFNFANYFTGYPLPLLPLTGSFTKLITPKVSHGLCGGMCFAAYDFFLSKKNIPVNTFTPSQKSLLYRYLYKRQIHTYGSFGKNIAKFAQWTVCSNTKIAISTFNEIQKVKTKLDRGDLVILGIVYVSIKESIAIWRNHQVLAYDYLEKEKKLIINIYDPNLPAKDNVTLEVSLTSSSAYCEQKYKDKKKFVRGIFIIPYVRVDPPFIL